MSTVIFAVDVQHIYVVNITNTVTVLKQTLNIAGILTTGDAITIMTLRPDGNISGNSGGDKPIT